MQTCLIEMNWRSLLHRWFVQYNPLYLVSAMLVLGGALLCSRALTGTESVAAPIGIALVTEVYAAALIGGAALLTRMGLRRPAVMIALLVALYQWDLTLHTETCAYLGTAGTFASIAWVGLFFAKMAGLAWALEIRFTRRFYLAFGLAAVGLAVLPTILAASGKREGGAVVALWAFALVSLYTPDILVARFELDRWGETVVSRSTRAVWALSGLLVSMHVLFWISEKHFDASPLLLVLPISQVRYVKREIVAWLLSFGTMGLVSVTHPSVFAVTALLAGLALAHRIVVTPAERARLVGGVLVDAYLVIWTLGWTGGPWPAHELLLDAAYVLALAVYLWRFRQWSAIVLGAAPFVPVVVRRAPSSQSPLEWGVIAVVAGFLLLGLALGATWWLRRGPSGHDDS